MTQDVDGSMWIDLLAHSNDLGGVVHIQNRQIVEEVTGLPDYVVPVVLPDPRGGLWFGLGHGQLAHYRDGKLDIISSFGPPSNSRLLDLTMDPKGRLLGATADGLVGLKDGLTKKLTVQNGLPCNRLYSMIFDDRGSLWLNATCGLLELTSDELQAWWENSDAKVRPRVFDVLDGAQPVLSPFGHTTAKSPDGTLWFANMFALQTVNPTQPNRNIKPPPVHIEELIANRKSYGALNNLRLPPLLRDLEIDYTALSFVSPKKVTFRYRLEGHDTDWQDPGARRQAFYSDLKPGKYTFRVIACNNSGLWNDVGDSLGFYVAPTFYQTLWFRILACGIAAAMLWAFYLFRLEQATAQIQERLGARMEERERIARELHDTLLQGFQGLMLRLQAVMKTLPAEEPAHQMLEKVLDRADEVLLEGRQSVRDLREEGTAGDELSKTLAQCGEELAQGQVCEFSLLVVGVPQTIGPIVFDEAHRIAREALINAFQHSRAQKIEVDLTYTDVGVSLHIRDDGAGIDPQILRTGKAGHWGLSGMRERAQKIGGQLKIWSNPVAGTEVELTIPAKVAYPQEVKQSLWLRIKQAVTRKKYVSAE
jgi:signal transduction histidine kinase